MGSALILISAIALIVAVSSRVKGRSASKERETAQESIAPELERIINLPSNSAELTEAGSPHTNGIFSWNITDVTPRLKKIDIRASLQQSVTGAVKANEGVGQTGYRYNDY